MQLTLANRSQNFIQSYDAHGVRIGDQLISQSSLITPTSITRWEVSDVASLSVAQLQPVFALKPQIVVLATGMRQQFPAMSIRGAFLAREIGLEVMELGAACRTFNVLLSEDRQVLMALLLSTGS